MCGTISIIFSSIISLLALSLDGKGGGNLPPPFGKPRIAADHVLDVTLRINRICQGRDDKPPLIIVKTFFST